MNDLTDNKLYVHIETFAEEYPREYKALRDNESAPVGRMNRFYSSLWTFIQRRGFLTLRQMQVLIAGLDADEEALRLRTVADAKVREEIPTVDLTPVKAMFDKVHDQGFKRPTFRALGLVLTRAPDAGRNPGAIYVAAEKDKTYLGRIVDRRFYPTKEGEREKALDVLLQIAADPMGAAVQHGKTTGTCACCGRTLTNKESIALGIGPVCASRWGLI